MSRSLVYGHDKEIAGWIATNRGITVYGLCRAIGVIDSQGIVVGGAVLHNWSKHDMELSYCGPGTVSAGMVRALAMIAFVEAEVTRVTLRVARRNKRLRVSLVRFGFKYEGIQERLFGPHRGDDAILFAMLADKAKRFLPRPQMMQRAA